jgi:hypothetical protein
MPRETLLAVRTRVLDGPLRAPGNAAAEQGLLMQAHKGLTDIHEVYARGSSHAIMLDVIAPAYGNTRPCIYFEPASGGYWREAVLARRDGDLISLRDAEPPAWFNMTHEPAAREVGVQK